MSATVGTTAQVSGDFLSIDGNTWDTLTAGEGIAASINAGSSSVDWYGSNCCYHWYWPYQTTNTTKQAFDVAKSLMNQKLVKVKTPRDFVELVETIEEALKAF